MNLMSRHIALIIEDDPSLNEIMALTLQADFTIETCVDGNAGLARLREITPHIVVLDLNLPGISGQEILTAIRADARFAQTRVILTTADERKAETLQDEADIVLLKPVSPVQLRELALRLRSM
jgi:DNA-binding response OmpR family regulator